MSIRPSDACPYPKPFTAEFNDCPAYQARHSIVLDLYDKPLRTIWSCRHLETKQIQGEAGHYYGACDLGDVRGRQEWVQRMGPERIRNIQKLRAQVMPLAQRLVDDVASLKGRQLEAAGSNGDSAETLALMRERGRRYLEEFEAFLRERDDLLELARMPLAACMQLGRQWVEEFVSETWDPSRSGQLLPDDLVATHPDSVNVFTSRGKSSDGRSADLSQ